MFASKRLLSLLFLSGSAHPFICAAVGAFFSSAFGRATRNEASSSTGRVGFTGYGSLIVQQLTNKALDGFEGPPRPQYEHESERRPPRTGHKK